MDKLRIALARVKPEMLVILTACVFALWLRVHRIGRESLWLDEGFSWRRARLPFDQLVAEAIGAHHNPSYFIFLRYWMWLGDDEFMLRLPSAIGGALAAGTTAAIGCMLGGPPAGLVAGTLLALAPVHIRFGQETRMYGLLSWTATVAVAGLVWLAMHPDRAAQPILRTARLHRWLERPAAHGGEDDAAVNAADPQPRAAAAWTAYVAGMVCTLYLHNTAALFALTAACAALLLLIHPFRLRLHFWINFIAANAVVIVGWSPYLGTQLTQVKTFSDAYFWAKLPTKKDLIGSARELYLMTSELESTLAILLLVAAALGVWSLRKRPEVALSVVCLAALGPVLLYLVSLHKPIYGTRLLLWVTPPFFALVGAGVAQWMGQRVWPSWAAAVMFVGAVGWIIQPDLQAQYDGLSNEPWREVAWTIRSRVIPGARILTGSYEEETMLDYYMHRKSHPLFEVPIEVARKRSAFKQVRDVPRAWLVDRKSGRRVRRARNELAARGRVVWDRSWHERLRVVQFDFDAR